MSKVRQLESEGAFFIGGETPSVYQHTGGLTLLDSSDRPEFGYEAFRAFLEGRIRQVPQFRWKLHEVPLGLDLPYWVEDPDFSFDHHIRRIAVPSPGDRTALADLVSYLYCRHLDRNRPLWETWFIEGLEDGRYALFQKMHHCLMDGEGANRLGEMMCDTKPDAPPPRVDPAIARARPGPVPAPWQQAFNASRHLSQLPGQASRMLLDAAWGELRRRLTWSGKSPEKPVTPIATFNGDVSAYRGFVYGTLPLTAIKTVKNHFGVTLNDVVLALVGTSLRGYLKPQRALPKESLRTSIAVSLRTDEDDEFSNRVTDVGVTLATHLSDPVKRLKAIAKESDAAKREARESGQGFIQALQMLPPVLLNAAMRLAPAELVPEFTGMNLLVSNVRGSALPQYIAGARTTAVYPMSIIMTGAGLNITCISYVDNVDFGITIDPELVPDPWLLIDGLERALEEYLALTRQLPPHRTKSKRKVDGQKTPAVRKQRAG